MKAFIVSISSFFKLNTDQNEEFNFDAGKRHLLIPLYQREYKWSNEKIESLIKDIQRRDKFLGNIIIDEKDDCYEIVDGQQRITTCFLTLICLYNCYLGHTREQQSIRNLLKPYDDIFVLQNNSIGNYLNEHQNQIQIDIQADCDVYYQKDDFFRAYNTINNFINSLDSQESKHDFKQKLLDCQFLVLINNQHNHTRPVEQLFLDINEKAQLLEVEDIFKGHCFENYDEDAHDDLRETWVKLKKCGMNFTKFGFDDVSQYLYLYLLERDNSNIPANLTIGGRHYLEGKTMDDTDNLLSNMISYGDSIIDFYDNIGRDDYRFIDLCLNSSEYRNTDDHKMLKLMCNEMLLAKAQYSKLPLMNFIYTITTNNEIKRIITHSQLKRIITNLYIYSTLVVLSGGRKSKQIIDHSVRDSLDSLPASMQNVINATKVLRTDEVGKFVLRIDCKFEELCFVYSIMEFYISNDNWLNNKYTRENHNNLEHFIIPDNKNRRITWKDGDSHFEFSLSQLLVSKNKKKTINFLIINDTLNEQIEHDDIVSKIEAIKIWYSTQHNNLPKHVALIINSIENMSEYITLKDFKGTNADHEAIEHLYIDFVDAYFSDEAQQQLLLILQEEFKASFSN